MLFTEGLDLVELECIVIARGVSHESTWVQIGGRALRPSPHTGKTHATILDLNGHVWRHGWLDDPRSWHLDGKSVRRQEQLPIAVMCAACLSWHRGGGRPCPHCGAALPMPRPPRVKARDLQEQRRGEPIERKQRRLVNFVRIALERGYSPWSAAHRYRGTYGRKPSRGEMAAAIAAARGQG
jgi:superfamily II DNA or RNA helicase